MWSDNTSLENTVRLIKTQLPGFDEITRHIRKSGGYLSLSSEIADLLVRDNLPPWSSMYDDPRKLKNVTARVLLSSVDFKKFSKKLGKLSESERKKVAEAFKSQILDRDVIDIGFEQVRLPTDNDFEGWLADTLANRNTDGQVNFYLLLYLMETQIHSYLAVMTFGRSICNLVKAAQEGDDFSYFAAVRVDKTVLLGLPYFRKRLTRAQVTGDFNFFQKLSNAIRGAPLGFKLSHRRLMFVFALLDDEGFLNIELKELHSICKEVGIKGIEDPEILAKRRKYYKDNAGRQYKF